MKKLRSKKIQDYFQIKLENLKPEVPISFDIHLFFPKNQHIVIFRRAGDSLSADILKQYLTRGVQNIWVHQADRVSYDRYLNPPAVEKLETKTNPEKPSEKDVTIENTPKIPPPEEIVDNTGKSAEKFGNIIIDEGPALSKVQLSKKEPAPVEKKLFEKPPEGSSEAKTLVAQQEEHRATLSKLMKSSELEETEKSDQFSQTAKTIIKQSLDPKKIDFQLQTHTAARNIVHDIIVHVEAKEETVLSEFWETAERDPDLTHSTNVATYSVLLALAFGKNDPRFIADLALAGLLHDIGLTQVSASLSTMPWTSMDSKQKESYSEHVDKTIELIDAFGPKISNRVKEIIREHHEKFDGTGYPRGLKGFKRDGGGEILAIAELVDSVSLGLWDGVKRTYRETLVVIDEMEKNRTFPSFFNPEILNAVLSWAQHQSAEQMNESASRSVENQARRIFG